MEPHSCVQLHVCLSPQPQEPATTKASGYHSYLERSGGFKQSSQAESTPMMAELSTVLLSLKAKSKSNEQHQFNANGHSYRLTKSKINDEFNTSPTKPKSWRAVPNVERQSVQIPGKSSVDTQHAESKLNVKAQETMEAEVKHGPKKHVPPSAAHVMKKPNPVHKPSHLKSTVGPVVNPRSINQLCSNTDKIKTIKPTTVHLFKEDSFKEEMSKEADFRGGASRGNVWK